MKLEVFKNAGFEIRGGLMNGEPYFVANDISVLLGYANTYAMLERLDDDEKSSLKDLLKSRTTSFSDLPKIDGVRYDAVLLTESGLYSAILWSQKPEAKQFKKWVTSEVLPTIRKHGAYATPETLERMIANPDFAISLLENLKAERVEKEKALQVIEEQKPLVSFANTIKASVNSMLIRNFAKEIKCRECDVRQWLLDHKYIFAKEKGNKTEYDVFSPYIKNGYFEIVPQTYGNPEKGTFQTFTVRITGKGMTALTEKIVNDLKQTA